MPKVSMSTGGKPQAVAALIQELMERFGADARLMDVWAEFQTKTQKEPV